MSLSRLKKLKLWKEFQKKANSKQVEIISNLVQKAILKTAKISDTFPTYTLHNHIHSENVVKLMGELLGSRITTLTSLELSILILSAYMHDIGMAFSNSERLTIADEPNFQDFLNSHSNALLRFHKLGQKPDLELTEFYCRWCHPIRIYNFLNTLSLKELQWGTIPLKDSLGEVCRSHGEDTRYLLNDDFKVDFLGEADLRFCAILLRLADILDFDNSRSPEEIYKHLGLGKRTTKRITISDIEWRKHLNSDGFIFPSNTDRTSSYILKIKAGPDDPAIENDMRSFLRIIENEFSKCAQALGHCSSRWQNFKLPEKIDLDDIISKNYKYGNFQFNLDKNEIMDLLMGEKLYDDPYIFVRELLQNSIDTSRFREYKERCVGNLDFKAKPINVSTWVDSDSYTWLRVDDFGCGMTEQEILKFLLNVGKSYYRSDEFKAELIKYKRNNKDSFEPISLYGIGILSCFILGDTIEISTNSFSTGNANPIRLTISGINSFYVLQSEQDHHNGNPMPRHDKATERFRKRNDYGTSVVVRINPKKEIPFMDIEDLLRRYIAVPPIEILYNGVKLRSELKTLLEEPILSKEIVIDLNTKEERAIQELFDDDSVKGIKILIVPIDLAKYSSTSKVTGNGVLFHITIPNRYLKSGPSINLEIRTWHNKLFVKLEKNDYAMSNSPVEIFTKEITNKVPKKLIKKIKLILDRNGPIWTWLSHNGVNVPTYLTKNYRLQMKFLESDTYELVGLLSLKDDFIPTINISRDSLIELNLKIFSTTALALTRALKRISTIDLTHLRIFHFHEKLDYSLGELLTDEEITSDNGWCKEPIIPTSEGLMSINELIKLKRKVYLADMPWITFNDLDEFMQNCIAALVQINLRIGLEIERIDNSKIFYSFGKPLKIEEGQKYFPPLFFVPYKNSTLLKYEDKMLNLTHSFSKWLIAHAHVLNEECPAIFKTLKSTLTDQISKDEIKDINEILTRIKKLNIGIKVHRKLRLSEFKISD